MAPLPVIPLTFRVTWNFATVSGVTPRIVQNFATPSEDVAEIGASIWGGALEGLFGPMLEGHEPQSISILPLDGVSGTVVVPRPGGTADLCLGTGQMMPAVAALVSFRTAGRGPASRGRSYVGPIVEQAQLDGQMDPTTRTNLEAAWVDTQIAWQAQDPAVALVVASYVNAGIQDIISTNVPTITATQRRRQDQLR